MNIDTALKEAMNIEGALGVALVDWDSGMPLGTLGGGKYVDLELAGRGQHRSSQGQDAHDGLAGKIAPFPPARKIRDDSDTSTSGNGASNGSPTEGDDALDGRVGDELPQREPGSYGAEVGVVDQEPADLTTLRKVLDGLTGL